MADLLAGTHCKRWLRTGFKCCNREIFETIQNVVEETATSPVFNSSCETPGVLANQIKRRSQAKFARAFEVIVSRVDFATATYLIGDFTCHILRHGFFITAYETPHQEGYHPYNKDEETVYSAVSDSDPLGTSNFTLPGQLIRDNGVELETDGYRLGFLKGSHCDYERRDGMKCCHMELFQSMHNTIDNLRVDDTFSIIDHRIIATKIRREAEIAINEPLQMIISEGDFVVNTHHIGDCHCKFKNRLRFRIMCNCYEKL